MEEIFHKSGKIVIIKFVQRLDVHSSVTAEEKIIDLIDSGEKYLLFNMSDVLYISSSGLRIFISALRKLREKKGMLKVCEMKENIRNVFQTVELLDLLELYETYDQAIEAFGELAED